MTPEGFNFEFLGLVGLADPIRPTASAAIQSCHQAGIRVVMITGDYPQTAMAIAKQLRIPVDHLITGRDLEEATPAVIHQTNVFARILPSQKLKIVEQYKSRGEIVAMTGDGVNDAPALKAANIGIAMGQRGTDVAREASGIVLLNDDLSSIVTAVKLGRRIFDNIKKAMSYIFAIHIPIAGLTLVPLILGWPLLFFPIHIAFLQLIIDPICSIAFEAEPAEDNVMERPPRKLNQSIFSRRMVMLSVFQGLSILLVTLVIYGLALYFNHTPDEARALAFTTLIIANLGLILVDRSWMGTLWENIRMPNHALWGIVLAAFSFLILSLNLPFFRRLFHFGQISLANFFLCITIGIFSVLWFEIIKVIAKRMQFNINE
jgi:P-type Ca2+ transporter type 2C